MVKIPRWDFEKFPGADPRLGTQMKSVGEVMAMGRTFKEALLKGVRGLEIGAHGLGRDDLNDASIQQKLVSPEADRLFYVKLALDQGWTIERVADLTRIDPWFLDQLRELGEAEADFGRPLDAQTLRRAKRLGFSDATLAKQEGAAETEIRARRIEAGVTPVFHRVDTCAAEFESNTPYLYSTYETESEAEPSDRRKIVILGSGPNRIGQGDRVRLLLLPCLVRLPEEGYETIMVNCNPETVSTDYDTSDRLYFEPLTFEDVMNVIDVEQPEGVVIQFGGQTPLKLALPLQRAGVKILGTAPDAIDLAEDRKRFSALLSKLEIPQPESGTAFEEVVHTLMAKDRDERFASAKDLLAVLDEAEHSDWWKTRVQFIRAETKQPIRRIRIPRETAIYGRDEEMDKLTALFEKVKKGEGQVVLVEGEAGIGKTRMVDEFAGRMRQKGQDLNFLFGAYPPGGAATAAGAFSTAYREQFGEEGLQETLKDYLTVTPSLIPAFAALLLGEATPEGSETLTKESIQTVFVHATRALAAERPTIILIDDLHLALEEGRALFAMLAMALQGSRVLLVGTCRPEVPAEWVSSVNRLDNATHVELRRLGPKDLSQLLVDAFRSEKLAEELGFQIGAKSDGNPFFVFEIVQGLRDGKYITQAADGSWLKTAVIEDIRIPSSVMELIDARLGELDEDDKDLLDVASCCGFEFDPGLVTDALGLGRIPALKRLGRIEKKHRLIRSAGVGVRVRPPPGPRGALRRAARDAAAGVPRGAWRGAREARAGE